MTKTKAEMRVEEEEEIHDRIALSFKGQHILITGGTGFMGKVMVEKFLRCLPDIEQIYMLVRPKKGKDPKHRLEEMFNTPEEVFGRRMNEQWEY